MATGYRDDHLHLLACAAARRSLDVHTAASIPELLALIRGQTQDTSRNPSGATTASGGAHRTARGALVGTRGLVSSGGGARGWLRVWGYDDALFVERRHPTVAELDAVTEGVPTVLHHITGHVAMVNAAAGRLLGLKSGDVLVERHDLLAATPQPDRSTTVTGVREVLTDMATSGIAACTDATHTNDLAALELLAEAAAGMPSVAVTAMVGADRLDSLAGRSFGSEVCAPAAAAGEPGSVRIGHAKVMPPHDDDSAIAGLIAMARGHGFPVAIHVMDIDTLQVTLDALEAHPPAPGQIEPDRIEHCALALPEQLDRIARMGLKVVTQPSFVTRRAQKYREQLSPTEQEWLWPLASLLRRGIPVTLSSDAPTVPPDPAEWIEAATSRDIAPAERIDAPTALRLCQQR